MLEKFKRRLRRKIKIRSKISGIPSRPRLCIYRSNTSIYAQIIDDTTGNTLCSSSDLKISEGTKTDRAKKVGLDLAIKASNLKITEIVFDRGGFVYHGRIKALADSAREGGLKF